MLVLSRKNQEAVMVGGSGGFERLLKVTVLEIKGGTVRLGLRGRCQCSGPPFGGLAENPGRPRPDVPEVQPVTCG